MNKLNLKHALLTSLLASMVAITGCEEKGPLEKAGETIDNTVDDARDAMDDAADEVKDTTEDAADDIDDIKDATDEVEDETN